jgi:predicted transcriptional regulator
MAWQVISSFYCCEIDTIKQALEEAEIAFIVEPIFEEDDESIRGYNVLVEEHLVDMSREIAINAEREFFNAEHELLNSDK